MKENCIWNSFHKHFTEMTPDPWVVECLDYIKAYAKGPLLDLGAGLGRHSLFFCLQGFNVIAMDLSLYACQAIDKMKQERCLPLQVLCSGFSPLPFHDNSFGGVICIHVIHHQGREDIRKMVSEVQRVLKPGGIFCLNMLSRQDNRFNKGRRVAPNTFVQEEGLERNIVHYFVEDQADVMSLLSGFSIINIEPYSPMSYWNILASC